MLYVQRDKAGKICSISAEQTSDAAEFIPSDSHEIFEFLSSAGISEVNAPEICAAYLAGTDSDLARVLEDLIDLLIDKSVIRLTDFPAPAQNRLVNRQLAREGLSDMDSILVDQDHLV
jgi:hypothetical protein